MNSLPADRRFAGWSRLNTVMAILFGVALVVTAMAVSRALRPLTAPTPTPAVAVPMTRGVIHAERGIADFSRMTAVFGIDTMVYQLADGVTPGEPGVDPGIPPAPPPQLVGVGVLPGSRFAILRFSSGQTRVLREGEQWEHFTVVSIGPDVVRIETADSSHALQLHGPATVSP